MLPTHRGMNNEHKTFYSSEDDKYDKISRGSKLKNLKHRLLIVFSISAVCIVYYLYSKQKNNIVSEIQHDDGYSKVEPETPFIPPNVFQDEELFEAADDEFEEELLESKQRLEANPISSVKISGPFLFTQSPPPQSIIHHDPIQAARQQKVIEAFRHAWKGYSRDCYGKDEYQPLTHNGHDWASGGIGLMIIDSLDTILLMNLTDEYIEARDWIATKLDFNKEQNVNVFETTIRVLGGLLSAYHLSENDTIYLEKAIDLADRLMYAFGTNSGIPYSDITLSNGVPNWNGASSTSEATTIQLEFKYLSHLTGDMKYWKAAEKVMEQLDKLVKTSDAALDGLVPIYIDPISGDFASREIRLGSRGDSYYEYLLKQYLQTAKSEIKYRERYDQAVEGIKKHLIKYSYPNHYLYIAEIMDSKYPLSTHPKMDHLVCFMGGSFILGVTEGASIHELDPLDSKDRQDWLFGEELTRTCFEMYNMTATGLASEIVYFNTDKNSESEQPDMEIHARDSHNLLRPETLESLFLLYRMTGEEKYREWGWKIFESFEEYTKLPDGGYSALKDVTKIPPTRDNRMDTFFLAETLKYLYLLFSPDDIIPLDKYVFNTEAHPLPIFSPSHL